MGLSCASGPPVNLEGSINQTWLRAVYDYKVREPGLKGDTLANLAVCEKDLIGIRIHSSQAKIFFGKLRADSDEELSYIPAQNQSIRTNKQSHRGSW